MGANFSSTDGNSIAGSMIRPRLGDIPESCIALVLANLDPPEICNLARLNRAFRGASSADFIWESKLPSNYRFIIEELFNCKDLGLCCWDCKKDIYARLSRPHSFDGGTKEIWLNKRTGGVCLSISYKAMLITGLEDRRYWNRIPTDESRFQVVAYLRQIWWFEVEGDLEFKFPAGTYSMFFRLQLGRTSKRLGRRVCNVEHIHGWDLRPVRFQLTTSDGQHAESHHYLDNRGSWVLYRVGDFVVEDPNKTKKIKFSAMQIDCTHIKGGLCVDCVLVYPQDMAKAVMPVL